MVDKLMEKQNIWLFSSADSHYWPRLLQLDSSLTSTNQKLNKYFLILDDSEHNLEKVTTANLIKKSDLLKRNHELSMSLVGRTLAEQYFTIAPSFMVEYSALSAPGDWLVYCDADIKFFSPIDEILEPFMEKSAVIVPHRHHWWNRWRLSKYGEFNVGLVAFRNSPEGLNLLNYWAQSCIQWCKDAPQSGKYADQKYLEDFLQIGDMVAVDTRVGANLAPWNASFHKLVEKSDGTLLVDGEPLLYFHMQGLKRTGVGWELGHIPYLTAASSELKKKIYIPYLRELEAATLEVKSHEEPATGLRRRQAGPNEMLRRAAGRLLGQTVLFRDLRKIDSDTSK